MAAMEGGTGERLSMSGAFWKPHKCQLRWAFCMPHETGRNAQCGCGVLVPPRLKEHSLDLQPSAPAIFQFRARPWQSTNTCQFPTCRQAVRIRK